MIKRSLFLTFILILLLTSCDKAPQQDLRDTESALESIKELGAEYYAKNEYKEIEDRYKNIVSKINEKQTKIFKKFSKEKKELISLREEAERLKEVIKERERSFHDFFVKTIGKTYILALMSSMSCAAISDFWKMAIKYSYLDVDEAVGEGVDALKKTGVYDILEKFKKEVEEDIKKIKDPHPKYKKSYDSLINMYRYAIKTYKAAISPSGSFISYNAMVNNNYGEVEKIYEEIIVILPEVKKEVESQEKELGKIIKKKII